MSWCLLVIPASAFPNCVFCNNGQVALGQTKFSKDGKLMAYTLSSGGSDWVYIKVLTIDQETGETTDLDDKLEYVKFSSLAWTHDHKVGR